jgi:glycosyltransferase involved in cell wall biosynthesis
LQHPPEVMLQFVEKWRQGYDIVYGDRVDRSTDGPFRKFYAKAFYRLFNFLSRSDIPSGAGDFRLLDRKAIAAMNRFKESSRSTRGSTPGSASSRSASCIRWPTVSRARPSGASASSCASPSTV